MSCLSVTSTQACKTFAINTVNTFGPCSGEVEDANARHKQWLTRRAGTVGRWRPARLFRKSVLHTLQNIDNQIRVSTSWPGLCHIRYAPSSATWQPASWRHWPSLSVAQDQGPDCVSSVHCANYKLNLNFWEWYDWSHGCANDLKAAVKAVHLWPFIILTLVCNNIGHGPERDELLRFHQLQEVLQHLFKNTNEVAPVGNVAQYLEKYRWSIAQNE